MLTDHVAFLHSLAALLKSKPAQPPGDGAIHRAARQLLATVHYKLSSAVAVGGAAPRHQRSKLAVGAAIK